MSRLLLLCFVVVNTSAALAQGDQQPQPDTSADLKRVALESVEGYLIHPEGEPSVAFELVKEPVVRFTTSGIDEGDIFLWTREDRPEVAVQVFRLGTQDSYIWLHEFQSLGSGPLVLMQEGRAVWKPDSAGVTWQELSNTTVPVKSPSGRLTQMKALARRFTGQEQTPGVGNSPELKNFELRMKPREILRYDAPGQGVVDGVVFYFAQEDLSDPELLLLIEAFESEGKTGWRFACAPLSCWPMQVQLDGKEAVNIPNRYLASKETDPYHIWGWRTDARE